ncbi:FAD-dependent oxidoreductase [Tissierellaceae bacterium HCP3S3_D8]
MDTNNLKEFKSPPISYWLTSTEKTNYPIIDKNTNVDIAIIGGGMVGILCAYQLQKEGFNIAILESGNILESTTAHTTAKLTSQHSLIYDKIKSQMGNELAKQYATANETAISELKKIIKENNIECDYSTQSAFIYTQEDSYIKKLEDEAKVASSLGIQAHLVDEIPFPIPIKSAMVFENQAQFHPRKFLLSLAEKISNKGVQIFEKSRAIELEEENNKYVINTPQGKKIIAEKVIIASHYPFYNKKAMYYSRIYVQRSYILGIKAKEKYPGGMYINAEDPPRSLRSLPAETGELILVVGENHKTGQGKDTNKHYESLVDFANEVFTVESIPYRWSTHDCMTLDGLPYVGHFDSETPNMYIATGFGKWGMTNSIASSMILRDLIINNENPWKDVYNPSRKTIASSTKNFIVQNANVASQLIDGKLSNLPEEVDIKPGEGKVLEVDGERAGAFRDENDKLHLVNTTCTHMGCELNWNSAERSWDCPCHGSRFTYEGEIIQGPAVKPLSFDRDVNTLKKLINEDF